jgi:hypothetical protein
LSPAILNCCGELTNIIYQKIAPSAVAGDLARLAHLYLAVPATSAPSERIWSRALRVLTLKRTNLKAKVSQRMMFIMENLIGLHKYYRSLAKHDTTEDKYFLIKLEKTHLPPLGGGDGDDHIDVGQNDE